MLRAIREPREAIAISKIEGKYRSIELETNLPLLRRLKRSTLHTWKIRGYIEDKNVIDSIIKALEAKIACGKKDK